jgi:hypothetical protein
MVRGGLDRSKQTESWMKRCHGATLAVGRITVGEVIQFVASAKARFIIWPSILTPVSAAHTIFILEPRGGNGS